MSATGTTTPPGTEQATESSMGERVAANVKTIAGAVILALIIRTVLVEPFEIQGPSMEPTLLNGDRVIVAKGLYGLFLPLRNEALVTWGSPSPGDVVIVKSPFDEVDIVKRVIGVAGDRIEVRDEPVAGELGVQHTVFRNGKALPLRLVGPCHDGWGGQQFGRCFVRESEVNGHKFLLSHTNGPMQLQSPIVVPPGHIFVMGDHRDSSNDSRAIGPVPVSRVKGRALSIYWSNDHGLRWGRMFHSVI